MKIIQNLILILHLSKRWVRWMLSLSILIIFAIAIFPGIKTNSIEAKHNIIHTEISNSKSIEKGLFEADTTQKSTTQPIAPLIVESKKPIDWKGSITWTIGLINGLVLVVLNVKNLIDKFRK